MFSCGEFMRKCLEDDVAKSGRWKGIIVTWTGQCCEMLSSYYWSEISCWGKKNQKKAISSQLCQIATLFGQVRADWHVFA